jgi:hypothetical protein
MRGELPTDYSGFPGLSRIARGRIWAVGPQTDFGGLAITRWAMYNDFIHIVWQRIVLSEEGESNVGVYPKDYDGSQGEKNRSDNDSLVHRCLVVRLRVSCGDAHASRVLLSATLSDLCQNRKLSDGAQNRIFCIHAMYGTVSVRCVCEWMPSFLYRFALLRPTHPFFARYPTEHLKYVRKLFAGISSVLM